MEFSSFFLFKIWNFFPEQDYFCSSLNLFPVGSAFPPLSVLLDKPRMLWFKITAINAPSNMSRIQHPWVCPKLQIQQWLHCSWGEFCFPRRSCSCSARTCTLAAGGCAACWTWLQERWRQRSRRPPSLLVESRLSGTPVPAIDASLLQGTDGAAAGRC